jgi:hypothetical protein
MFGLMNCRLHLGQVQSGRDVMDDRRVIDFVALRPMIEFTGRKQTPLNPRPTKSVKKHAVPRFGAIQHWEQKYATKSEERYLRNEVLSLRSSGVLDLVPPKLLTIDSRLSSGVPRSLL